MTRAERKRFNQLVRLAAVAYAFLPADSRSAADDLLVEAVDLLGGWDAHDPTAPAGTQSLPVADAVLEMVYALTNALRASHGMPPIFSTAAEVVH